jgi:hypothetical protein
MNYTKNIKRFSKKTAKDKGGKKLSFVLRTYEYYSYPQYRENTRQKNKY